MGHNFDVIIPCSTYDVSFLAKTVSYVRKNIVGCETIFAITSRNNIKKLSKIVRDNNFKVLDEDKIIEGLSFASIYNLLNENYGEWAARRTGWYYQQFLKMAFGLSSYAKEYYLSWDADTLPIRPISFFDKDLHPLFTQKDEYNELYFATNERLIGIGKVKAFSYIAEHMLFNSNIMKHLISNIEKCGGGGFASIIIKACHISDPRASYFSEFELYGSYCSQNYPQLYHYRVLRTFRGAGMIRARYISERIIDVLSVDLDTASFEKGHFLFPYNIPFFFNRVKRRIIFEIKRYGFAKSKK